MKTFEYYRSNILAQPSAHLRELLLGEAEASGLTAAELGDLAQAAELAWA